MVMFKLIIIAYTIVVLLTLSPCILAGISDKRIKEMRDEKV